MPLTQGFYLGLPGRPWPRVSEEAAALLPVLLPVEPSIRERGARALQPA